MPPTDHSAVPAHFLPDHLVSRLRFRHLRLLSAVQQGGSLRAAAQALSLTQPALSKALTEIEGAFGFALFTRGARGLAPTPQGEVVLRGAALLLAELAHVRQEAAAVDRFAASVRIGAPPFVAQSYLPAVLARLVGSGAPVRVQLIEERVPALMHALRQGEVDALVTTFPLERVEADAGTLRYEKLFEVQFALIAASADPLARARRLDWQRLAAARWVMPAAGSMGRKIIEECFMHAGVPPPLPVVEATSPITSVQLVAAGLGVGMVPDVALLGNGLLKSGPVRQLRVHPAPPASAVALVCREGPRNPRVALLRQALGL